MTSANQSGTDASTPNRKSQTISCAECRRLKLKCDRVFPCSSCIRRGCANLCPNGTLEKGKRGFLRRLEQSLPPSSAGGSTGGEPSNEVAMFVARDKAMASRIQELEMALTNAGVPIPGAPMLNSKALKVEGSGTVTPSKRPRSSSPISSLSLYDDRANMDEQVEDVALGFGTLTIDVENRSRYIGLSGSAAYLNPAIWKTGKRQDTVEDSAASDWSHILNISLPPYEEAARLADIYFTHASWMYEVIPREIFFHDHLVDIYLPRPKNVPHGVRALFYIVLSLGVFFDFALPASIAKDRASYYHSMAIQWLSTQVQREGTLRIDTIPAVQALHLLVTYYLSTRVKGDGEAAWQFLGMAMRALQAQGCHRDGSRWNLAERELEERRRVFWETHYYDRVQSLTFGRPYAMGDEHHDCEMPETCDVPLSSDSTVDDASFSHLKWHKYKFRFTAILGNIADRAFSAKHPTYSTILDLDKQINDFYASLPTWMICDSMLHPVKELRAGPGLGGMENMRREAQVHSFSNMIYLALLHLHRGPFCRALTMDSNDPLKSKYEASVVSLVMAARAMINITRGMFSLYPELTTRTWSFFFHAFSAAVCLAVLVIVAPFHHLSPLAYESMQGALELFTLADSPMAELARDRMARLAQKAKSVMDGWKATSEAQTKSSNLLAVPRSMPRRLSESSTGQPEHLLGASTTLIRVQPAEPAPPVEFSYSFSEKDVPVLDVALRPSSPMRPPSPMPPPSPTAGWNHESYMNLNYLNNPDEAELQPWPGHPDVQHNININFNPDLNVDGFDLSTFIQAGANPWSSGSAYDQNPLDIEHFFGNDPYQ